jgi:hypothetical protein
VFLLHDAVARMGDTVGLDQTGEVQLERVNIEVTLIIALG